jgi:hypothetical protein
MLEAVGHGAYSGSWLATLCGWMIGRGGLGGFGRSGTENDFLERVRTLAQL